MDCSPEYIFHANHTEDVKECNNDTSVNTFVPFHGNLQEKQDLGNVSIMDKAKKQHQMLRKLVSKQRRLQKQMEREKKNISAKIMKVSLNLGTVTRKVERKLEEQLPPKLKEIEDLKEKIKPYPEYIAKKENDIKVLTDGFKEYKETVNMKLVSAAQKLLSSMAVLKEQRCSIQRKLNQRWRIFGKAELRKDLDNIDGSIKKLHAISMKIASEVQYLNVHFKYPLE